MAFIPDYTKNNYYPLFQLTQTLPLFLQQILKLHAGSKKLFSVNRNNLAGAKCQQQAGISPKACRTTCFPPTHAHFLPTPVFQCLLLHLRACNVDAASLNGGDGIANGGFCCALCCSSVEVDSRTMRTGEELDLDRRMYLQK